MHKVLIYSTPTCKYCKAAKAFFAEHNVSYEEKDVSTDQAALEDMVKKTNQWGVPVIQIDNNIIIGYDQVQIASLLGIAA